MLKIRILCLLTISNLLLIGQSQNLPELIPYCVNSKWGYYNTKTKELGCPELSESINKEFELLQLLNAKNQANFEVKQNEEGYYYIVDNTGNKKSIYSIDRFSSFVGISEGLACFNSGRKFKYINSNAKVVIEVEGEKALPFSEGKAVYRKRTKDGYIDKSGKVVISFKFDNAKDFGNGLAPVKIKDYWGYIDTTGKVVIPPIYQEANTFANGLAYVNYDYNSYGYIDLSGNEYFPRELRSFRKGNLWGLYVYTDYAHRKQKVIISPKYHSINEYQDVFVVSFNNKYGLLNIFGEEILPLEYDFITKEGRYFRLVKKSNDKSKYGVIDKKGKRILEPIYEEIVFDCNSDGNIDEKDKGFILRKDNKLGFYNTEGKEILPFICDASMGLRLQGDLFYIKVNEKKGLADLNGKILIPPKYDDFSTFSEGYASYMRDGKWGHLYSNGLEIIPPTYDNRYYFSEGMAYVVKDNKYGFINYDGEVVVPLIYDKVESFNDGLAKVEKNNKFGYINKKGEIVVPIDYDDIENFYYGFAVVKRGSTWGFVDKSGKEVAPTIYSYVKSFNNPYVTVVKSGGKYGIIDNKGKLIFEPIYDSVNYRFKDDKDVIFSFFKDGKSIYYRVKGTSFCECDQYGNCK